jgi:predicted metal-dependent peptidase
MVYWDEYLQNYLGERLGQEMLTYSRPNRRSEAVREILAGRRRRNSPDVTVLWDTSGSQSGWEKRVLSEIQGICDDLGAEARVIVIDTAIYADVMIEDAEDIINEVAGGGGSDFTPAFDRLEEEGDSSVVLAFTDGYITVPNSKPEQIQDVLWVITEGGQKPANYGSTIHITKNGEVKR